MRLLENPRLVRAGLLGGAATASGIALTATSGWLIARAAEHPVLLTLLVAIVAVRTFGMARPLFRYLERLDAHDAALADLADRRARTFATLIPLTPARLGRRSRAALLSGVVDDLTDDVDAQVRVTVPVIASAVAGLVAVALTAALAPAVGVVLAGLLVVVALGCDLARRLESRAQDDLLAARSEVLRVSDLIARQAGELRALGAEPTALTWLDAAHRQWDAAVGRQSRGRALVAALLLVATASATVLSAWLAARAAVSGPVMALLVLTPVAVGDALAPLADAMRAQARAAAARGRLHGLLDQAPAVAETPADGCGQRGQGGAVPHLRLSGVSATWRPGDRAPQVGPLDLDLPPGTHLVVAGPNGAGKSTLLAVLARHLDPLTGRYTVDGTDVRELPLATVRELIAVLDDEPHLFAGTVRANLLLARPDAADTALIRALTDAGLGGWLTGLPEGLDTRLGSGGRGLSGGERARLGLARVLLSQRPIVLLDEPVAHLDHATAVAVVDDLLRACAGRTVVMVSHRAEGISGFGETLVLNTPLQTCGKET